MDIEAEDTEDLKTIMQVLDSLLRDAKARKTPTITFPYEHHRWPLNVQFDRKRNCAI